MMLWLALACVPNVRVELVSPDVPLDPLGRYPYVLQTQRGCSGGEVDYLSCRNDGVCVIDHLFTGRAPVGRLRLWFDVAEDDWEEVWANEEPFGNDSCVYMARLQPDPEDPRTALEGTPGMLDLVLELTLPD